ncbi:MAG: protein kinase, partial [Myxococcota bacterium]
PLAPKVACDVMWQVAEAVRYIHGKSIIHGDIKSENILLTSTPDRHRVVKLLDFGLARVDVARSSRSIEGTPEYMAPERVHGQAASQASDIYALGILFVELLLGAPPFRGDMEAIFRLHIEDTVPRPSKQLGDALDSRADELIARATAKDPAERHADVAGFMYELRTLMNMLGMATGRRRKNISKGKSERARALMSSRRTQGAAEVFQHAPVPLAAVDGRGKVRVANRAFLDFLGVAGDAAGIALGDSGLVDVYPTLLHDLDQVAKTRTVIKRIIHICERKSGPIVEVAVILSPGASELAVTAGNVHITLHPLGRIVRHRDAPGNSDGDS